MEPLAFVTLVGGVGAALGWTVRRNIKHPFSRRLLLLTLALSPLAFFISAESTACVAEQAQGLLDCDDDVAWLVAIFFFAPLWIVGMGIGAALSPTGLLNADQASRDVK